MKTVWKIFRILLIIMAAIVLGLFLLYSAIKQQGEIRTTAFDDLKLHLVGVVYNIDRVHGGYYNGFGIIRLRVLSSNVQSYDRSQNKRYFYCTIKDGKAEIYDHASPSMIGDTVTIDTEKQLIKRVGKDGVTISDGSISMSSHDDYYDYIRTHKQL